MTSFNEKDIERILKDFGKLQSPENSILRAKNVVMAGVRQETSRRLSINKRSKKSFLTILKLKNMPIIALIIAVALGGGGTVAAAQNDNPGDALYGVKIASERIAEAAVTVANDATEINFKEKLAARRAGELDALRQRIGHMQEKKKTVLMNHIEATAERLENHVERINAKVKKLQLQDTEESAEIAARLQSNAEVFQGVLAALEANPELEIDIKAKIVTTQVKLEKYKARARAAESKVKKRHLSEVGLENSAKGKVKAAENKMQAATEMRDQFLKRIENMEDSEKAAFMKEEFNKRDGFYQDGVKYVEAARAALEQEQWEEAISKAGRAFKVFVMFASPLGHRVQRIEVDTVEEIEAIDEVLPTLEVPETGLDKSEVREAIDRAWELLQKVGSKKVRLEAAGNTLPTDINTLMRSVKDLLSKAEQTWGEGQIDQARRAVHAAEEIIKNIQNLLESSAELEALSQDQVETKFKADHALFQARAAYKELQDYALKIKNTMPDSNLRPSNEAVGRAKALLTKARLTYGLKDFSAALSLAREAEQILRDEFQNFLKRTKEAFEPSVPDVFVEESVTATDPALEPEILTPEAEARIKKPILPKKQTTLELERNFAQEMAQAAQKRALTALQKHKAELDDLARQKIGMYEQRAREAMLAEDYGTAKGYYNEVVDVINAAVARAARGEHLPAADLD